MTDRSVDHLSRRYGYKSYQDYLNGDWWRRFSDSVRDSECYCCGGRCDLVVHHLTYNTLCREREEDVVTVCGGCHEEIHLLIKDGVRALEAPSVHRDFHVAVANSLFPEDE